MWRRISIALLFIIIIVGCESKLKTESFSGSGPMSRSIHEIDFDHTTVLDTPCINCHNNVIEEGKPNNHPETSDECGSCHNTKDWDQLTNDDDEFDHSTVVDTPCINCHNNDIEEGKPEDHPETSDECGSCHNTKDWDQLTNDDDEFDHTTVADTPCINCHNNDIEEGKPDDHPQTSDECGTCHNTNDWDDITSTIDEFDHTTVAGTPCINCHNNDIELGKPQDHPLSPDECEICHSVIDWGEIITAP